MADFEKCPKCGAEAGGDITGWGTWHCGSTDSAPFPYESGLCRERQWKIRCKTMQAEGQKLADLLAELGIFLDAEFGTNDKTDAVDESLAAWDKAKNTPGE